MAKFSELGISKSLIKGLKELGIETPTEIQEQTIPILLNIETDFIGQAQTGTGKTAAFGLPILQTVDPKNEHIQALILAPTRELGQQIAKQLFKFTKYASNKIFIEAVFGGAKIDEQISKLRRPTQVLVATPGRLCDLLERKAVKLDHVHTVVLDEADEMLSMGFKKDLNRILDHITGKSNIWLFSATMSEGVKQIIKTYLSQNAKQVQLKKKGANENIEHQFVICDQQNKLKVLLSFLQSQGENRGLIFCNTKATTQTLSKQLIAKNVTAGALEGDMKQKERDKVMRAFKNESLQILVSTDVSARGIDVKGLSYVVHYQIPEHLEYFTHRSGRTGRAGLSGLSLCLINESEIPRIRFYEKELGIKVHQVK